MKRIISITLSLLVCIGLPLMALAEEITTCTVTADSLPAAPGKEIAVPVRIAGNQGFTNFAVSLEYDPEKLELISIHTMDGQTPYLCGALAAANICWENAEKKSCGHIVSASAQPVTGDGILFTATFQAKEDFSDFTEITPVVQYIRNNSAVFSVFETITADVTPGKISAIVAADVTGDGIVEYDDVMLAYQASQGEVELTDQQMIRADINGDKQIDSMDVDAIYQIYAGG